MSRPARILLRTFVTLLQIAAFCALFFLGAFWAFVRLWALVNHNAVTHLFGGLIQSIPVWRHELTAPRYLVTNGIVFASALFVLLLLVEALVRRFRPYLALTTLAFLVAVLFDVWQRLGLVSPS